MKDQPYFDELTARIKDLKRDQKRDQERAKVEALAARRREYDAYLRSPEWRAKRALVIERAKGRCERCGRPRKYLQVHHGTYVRVFNEKLTDLAALCGICHEAIHDGKDKAWVRKFRKKRRVWSQNRT